MKATILLLTSIFLISFGCSENCVPASTLTTYEEGKEFMVNYDSTTKENTYTTPEGPYVLFRYLQYDETCEDAVDAGLGETLYFAIPDSLSTFQFVDSALLQINCYYDDANSWMYYTRPVSYGVIEGNKIANGDWSVKVDIHARPESPFSLVELKHIKFEGIYTK